MLKKLNEEEKYRLTTIMEKKKDLIEEASKYKVIEEDLNNQIYALFDIDTGKTIGWHEIILSLLL